MNRRRGWKIVLKSGLERTLPAQLGQLKTGQGGWGIVAKSYVVPQRPFKVMN